MKTLNNKYNFLRPLKAKNLIRLGREEDGGYVVEKSIIKNCNILISFGLGSDWSFELDFIKSNKSAKIYVYDYTVSIYSYLSQVFKHLRRFLTFRSSFIILLKNILLLKNYLNFLLIKQIFFFKEKITYPVKKTKSESDIKKVFSRIPKESEVILKVDIEGSEYELIDQILYYSDRIKMIILEFHWLDKKEKNFIKSVKKIQNKFNIIHLHGNNHLDKLKNGLPKVIEMTFVNKGQKINIIKKFVTKFPIQGLDFSNNPLRKDLEFCFKRNKY